MELVYKKSESSVYPVLIDTESSKTTVYIRKDVEEKQRTDPTTENSYTYYEYQEAKMTKDEYIKYLLEKQRTDIDKQRADTDYIAIMTGIDLEEGSNE